MSLEEKLRWARRYVDRGWPVFVLGRDKTPLPNCSWCAGSEPGSGRCAGRGTCGHLHCHGFYAATTYAPRIISMIQNYPDGMLGIRTGDGLTVLDFEGTEKGHETYDQFESYTGVDLPRDGLAQRTGGLGIHVVLDTRDSLIKSRNRVLPDMDVKSAGGYIAVGPSLDARGWLNDGLRMGWSADIPLATPDMLGWLVGAKGNFGGQGGAGGGSAVAGGDWYRDALMNGCPGGLRDEFFNRLIFSLRKQDKDKVDIQDIARRHWYVVEQPPVCEWYMPWEHVQYKIDRVWATVEPDEAPEWQDTFTARRAQLNQGEAVIMGRRAIVRRDK